MHTEIVKTNAMNLFEKRTVAELSDWDMAQIDGGTTLYCVYQVTYYAAVSSEACGVAIAAGAILIYNAVANRSAQ